MDAQYNNLWRYQDSRGITRVGALEKYLDHGGTDHTMIMRRETGEVDCVSGSRLKAAVKLYKA